jgi:hypothetical protein
MCADAELNESEFIWTIGLAASSNSTRSRVELMLGDRSCISLTVAVDADIAPPFCLLPRR